MDVVSDAIAVMRTGTPSSTAMTVHQHWRVRFAAYAGAGFHVLLGGSCVLHPRVGDPITMGVGDVVLLPHGSEHDLADASGTARVVPFESVPELSEEDGPVVSELLCGKYRLDQSRSHPLLAQLPDVVHVRAGEHPALSAAVDLLSREARGAQPGRDAAVPGLLDVLFVYALRGWLAGRPSGWSRALVDPVVSTALQAMHADPARDWRVAGLAAAAGLSRAAFARRFTALVGRPPMAYLTWWRLTAAARVLRESRLPLAAVARQAGYQSQYAFSHAFKRQFGTAPAHYRTMSPLASTV